MSDLQRSFFLALFISLTSALPGAGSQRLHAQTVGVRRQDWMQTTAADFASGEMVGVGISNLVDGELYLPSSTATGVYTSPAVTPPFAFNAIAPHWQAVVPDGTALRVELRVYREGNGWSPWYLFDDVDRLTSHGRFYPETPLLLSDGLQFQYRLTLTAAASGQSPVLDEMTVTIIDATGGPTTSQAKAAARPVQITSQAVPQPTVIPRDGWGADEGLRYDDQGDLIWLLEYQPVEKVVVHHTVSVNDYKEDEAAGWVRAIYQYHAVTLGWGDIGYNYLVDKFGNIYEGRYGGPDVVGGHVYDYNYGSMGIGTIGTYGNTWDSIPPTAESLVALTDLAAWEASRSYIHPLENAPFYDAITPNLAGHRDYPPGTTVCPGDYLYAELPGLRQASWERIVTHTDPYHMAWLAWNTPPHTLLAGETYSLIVTVRNTGWFTWPNASAADAVRLGYHWFDDHGQTVVQLPQDDHRSGLDHDLAFGHVYDFESALFTTPSTPGVYTLAWDMVHQDVTWFHDTNPASPLLTMTLSITNTPPVTISGELLDVRGHSASGGQVALPGWLTVTADKDGAYALPRLARAAYTLTASAKGYALLPPAYAVDASGGDVTFPFVFVPDGFTNLVTNGDFEDGLTGWARGGEPGSLPVSTTAAHTGFGAAQLDSGAWLSQAAILPAQAVSPTLSLLYHVPGDTDNVTLQVALTNESTTITHTIPLTSLTEFIPSEGEGLGIGPSILLRTSAAGWKHFWTDLPTDWHGSLDMKLELTQSDSLTPATVVIDEVWLGYQDRPSCIVYLPIVLKAHMQGGCSELMANGGFEETVAWDILNTSSPAVYSVAQAHSGSRSLLTGIEPGSMVTQSYSSAQQTVVLPAALASATLQYWWYPVSDDVDDLEYALILDTEGKVLDSLLWATAGDQTWLNAQADLIDYAGQTVTLRFGVYNDGDTGLTRLYVDDVSLQVCPRDDRTVTQQ